MQAIGTIPYPILSAVDMGNICRFLIKTSLEKQLVVYHCQDVVGIFVQLLLFLKLHGDGFSKPISSVNSTMTATRSPVVPDALRCVAQIMVASLDKMNDPYLRLETLKVDKFGTTILLIHSLLVLY